MLRRASAFDNDADFADVYLSTFATIFLGTPFRGSSYAAWARIAERLVSAIGLDSSSNNLKTLTLDSQVLRLLCDDFCTLERRKTFTVRIFREAKGMVGIRPVNAPVSQHPPSHLEAREADLEARR